MITSLQIILTLLRSSCYRQDPIKELMLRLACAFSGCQFISIYIAAESYNSNDHKIPLLAFVVRSMSSVFLLTLYRISVSVVDSRITRATLLKRGDLNQNQQAAPTSSIAPGSSRSSPSNASHSLNILHVVADALLDM